jgi:hypothetical protein
MSEDQDVLARAAGLADEMGEWRLAERIRAFAARRERLDHEGGGYRPEND